jgi:hypothetical protein
MSDYVVINPVLPNPVDFLATLSTLDDRAVARWEYKLRYNHNKCFDYIPVRVDYQQHCNLLLDIVRAVRLERSLRTFDRTPPRTASVLVSSARPGKQCQRTTNENAAGAGELYNANAQPNSP